MKSLLSVRLRQPAVFATLTALLLLCSGCSVKSNTALTRFYHGMATRYNILYNGQKAYDEAYEGLFSNLQEGYSQQIPTDPIVYQLSSGQTAGSTMKRPIEKAQSAIRLHSLRTKPERRPQWRRDPKAVAMQQRSEYNPAMYRAWQLLGQAHLYNADPDQALATFAYMTRLYATDKAVRDRALLWQLRVLSLTGRPSEGAQILSQIDTTDRQRIDEVRDVYHLALAEYYLSLSKPSEAEPHLVRAIPYAEHSVQRARLSYLLGQLRASGRNAAGAYEAYTKTLRYAPPNALDFAARIRQAELLPQGHAVVLRQLRRMSRRSRYRDQLDQIFHAIARTELSAGDTVAAMRSFRLSADSSRLRREDYALSLVALGRLHLERHEWLDAHRAYSAAMPSLPATHPDYTQISYTARGLDSLQPVARIVHEGDSVLRLAAMPPQARARVIDSVISELKRREAEEARQRARDSIAEHTRALQQGMPPTTGQAARPVPSLPQTDTRFYFYNPQLLDAGRQSFEKQWGLRSLTDNWRRRQRSSGTAPTGQMGETRSDSLATDGAATAEASVATESHVDDPHHPEYYLSRLPLDAQSQDKLNESIEEAMAGMGRILSEHLELLPEAMHQWRTQITRWPEGKHHESSLYALHMMCLRLGHTLEAETLRQQYIARYGDTPRGRELSSPGYIERLRTRDAEVERLYQQAYQAYMKGESGVIEEALARVQREYPTSEALPRLLFLSALTYARGGQAEAMQQRLNALSLLPNASEEIRTLSGAMLAGLAEGRKLSGASPSSIDWSIATGAIAMTGTRSTLEFAPPSPSDRYALLVLAPMGDMSQSECLFALTAFAFTELTQEQLTTLPIPSTAYHLMSVSGFSSLAALREYASRLAHYLDGRFVSAHLAPISLPNLPLITGEDAAGAYLLYLASEQPQLPISYTAPTVETLPESQLTSSADSLSLSGEGTAPIDFSLDRSELETVQADTVATVEETVLVPREASLSHSDPSYESVQQRAEDRQKQERISKRAAEKARKAEAKQRERERQAALRAKERERKEKLRERERARRAKTKSR